VQGGEGKEREGKGMQGRGGEGKGGEGKKESGGNHAYLTNFVNCKFSKLLYGCELRLIAPRHRPWPLPRCMINVTRYVRNA